MNSSTDAGGWWQVAMLAAAVVFLLLQMLRGWQRGVMRQMCYLLALICSYAAAWFGKSLLVPQLRTLGYPDFLLTALSGALLGFAVFVGILVIGAIVFKKTSQQDVGIVRMGYGLLGAAAGLATGLLFVWIAVLAVRLIGTVAEVQVTSARRAAKAQQPGHTAAPPQPSRLVVGVAQMKRSIEQGPAGGIVKAVDPLPPQTYEIIGKIGRVMDDREIADRFMNFPGVKTLSQLPKIVALTSDEEIIRELRAKNYIALLKNKHIVEVANDPQINSMVGKVDFQKALDYALEK